MSDSPVTLGFNKPFNEQVAAFRRRLGNLLPTARWDDVWQQAHDTGFMVAGAAKADLLGDLAAAVDRTITEGGTLEAFRNDFRGIVARHGWHGWTGEGSKAGEGWRTRVIYRTNMATSFAAGRLAQLKASGFAFWIYRHSGAEHPRLDHKSWDRVVLPPDHPFWTQHYPPNGWGCGCKVSGTHSADGARRRGGDPDKQLPANWDKLDPKTGAQRGIGKGWGYAPGASIADDLRLLGDKLPKLPAPIGAAWFASIPDRRKRALAEEFGRFVDTALEPRGQQGRHMIIGALKPAWINALRRHGVEPASAEIAVRDEDVRHTFRPAKIDADRALHLGWYKDLPFSLTRPDLVLLQRNGDQNALMILYPSPEPGRKVVALLDYRLKRSGDVLNVLRTGNTLGTNDIRGMLADERRYARIDGGEDL